MVNLTTVATLATLLAQNPAGAWSMPPVVMATTQTSELVRVNLEQSIQTDFWRGWQLDRTALVLAITAHGGVEHTNIRITDSEWKAIMNTIYTWQKNEEASFLVTIYWQNNSYCEISFNLIDSSPEAVVNMMNEIQEIIYSRKRVALRVELGKIGARIVRMGNTPPFPAQSQDWK